MGEERLACEVRRSSLRNKSVSHQRHFEGLLRYPQSSFDTSASTATVLSEDDNPLGLPTSPPITNAPAPLDADTSIDSAYSTDTLGALVPQYRAGDGHEPDKLQPDFLGTKRMPGEAILHKTFGMWEIKRNDVSESSCTVQFGKYLLRLQQKGVCDGFRAFLVKGDTTLIFDINGIVLGVVDTAGDKFCEELQSLLRTALAIL